MLPSTALKAQGLYRLISSTLDRYLLYEIVKRPARVLLIECFKPPRSRSRYLSAATCLTALCICGYSGVIAFPRVRGDPVRDVAEAAEIHR